MPDRNAVALELAERIDALVARELTKLKSPGDRARAAHELAEHLYATVSTVRALRGDAIRALRAEDVTWPAVGELLDVSPQRAQQLAMPQLSEVTPK